MPLKFTAGIAVFFSMISVASGQPRDGATVQETLTPGTTAWITDSSGREEKARIVGVSGSVLTVAAMDGVRQLRTSDVVRVRVRESDSVINGALIGAGAAVASGLLMCRAMEPWDVCRSNVGSILRLGALGAGIGVGVDALIRGRRTIYDASQGSLHLHAAPMLARDAAGLQLSLSF
jgi:hypothetical protein